MVGAEGNFLPIYIPTIFYKLPTTSRMEIFTLITKLMSTFKIARPYAMTLYQSHRKDMIASGKLTEVFTIRDFSEGKTVAPYVSSSFVVKPGKNDSTTAKAAVKAYETTLKARITSAKTLTKPATKKTAAKKTAKK